MNIAEQLVEVLVQPGVARVYGVVGDSLNPIVDAIRRHEGIEWVHVRNEEAGAFAASAEAQITGRLAVCAGSSGPGNTHLIQGLYDANRSGAPVLALASHIPTSTRSAPRTSRRRAPKSCSSTRASGARRSAGADQMPRMLRVAIQEAIAKQGVSVLVVPGNVADLDVEHDRLACTPCASNSAACSRRRRRCTTSPTRSTRRETVTLFCGAGVRGAHREVMALAEAVKAPIGHSLRGKEWIQFDNPLRRRHDRPARLRRVPRRDPRGRPARAARYRLPVRHASSRDDDRRRSTTNAAHLGRRTALEVAVHGDVGETLRALARTRGAEAVPHVPRRHAAAPRASTRAGDQRLHRRHRRQRSPIHPEYRRRCARRARGRRRDLHRRHRDEQRVGGPLPHTQRTSARHRIVHPRHDGERAAARDRRRVREPGRQVIAMSGDGGLAMLLGELLTVQPSRPAADRRGLQQLLARHGGARDARRRLSPLRHRQRRRELRRHRGGRRAGVRAHHRTRRAARRARASRWRRRSPRSSTW